MIYEYECQDCQYRFETEQSAKEKPLKKCPKCKKKSLERLLFAPLVSIRGNINTIGQLAEANTKKLGRYEKDKVIPPMTQEEKNQKDSKEHAKKLNKLSPERKQKYIHTGEL